jgi:hypothetical protein
MAIVVPRFEIQNAQISKKTTGGSRQGAIRFNAWRRKTLHVASWFETREDALLTMRV